MQDFTAFPRYLPERIWNALLTSSNQKDRLEYLVKFCISLGMRCPSEPTIGGLVWLSTCALRAQEISESEKVSALKESKPNIRRWLANLADPVVYLQALPTNVDDCPAELMQHAFPQGFHAYTPPGFQLRHYEEVVRRFPLRRREGDDGKGFSAGLADEYTHFLGKLFAGAVEGALGRSASTSSAGGSSMSANQTRPLPLLDLPSANGCEPPLSAGRSGSGRHSLSAGQASIAPLALEDAKEDPPLSAPQGACEAPTVESQLQGLREALRAPMATPDEGDVQPGSKKRPASKKPVAASSKKQAAAPAGSAGAKKRPAAREVTPVGGGSAGSRMRPAACEAALPGVPHRRTSSLAGSARPDATQLHACKAKAKSQTANGKSGTKAKSVSGQKEYRQRLLASIPSALKKRFANGCTTCRNRPMCCNSCWFKRGFRV